ncbi:hypothetical protein CSC94_06635 [Zhengella mangrovi]|uniref:Uncharacterized protein n=1 Tax=Zhengella mangrovi TaxID=1982044 RepID=A0A2G1QS61_9HYPH|nr:hypothetical protein CSC94_06635 [Zhengella mangrovi]
MAIAAGMVAASALPAFAEQGEQPISWHRAMKLVRHCKVETAFQSHRREVSLVLRNGRRLRTIEPRMDDIIHAIQSMERRCGFTPIATE